MSRTSRTRRLSAVGALATLLALGLSTPASPADDTALFSVSVAPNVMLLMDNSGSMNELVWHPAYNDTVTPTCNYYDNNSVYQFSSNALNLTRCSKTVSVYVDPALGSIPTRVSGRYLNWLFSAASTPYNADINSLTNGTYSACIGGGTYGKYRRARVTAGQNVLKDVICQVNQVGKVRFGLAQFREGSDPNGGYVLVPANDYLTSTGTPNVYTLNGVSKSHGDHLNDAIAAIDANAWTPLGESLFQVYTYFMSRSNGDIPKGKDGSTQFPKYSYLTTTANGGGANTSSPPDSPVTVPCQKNFVIIITDGEPTMDDFDVNSPTNTANGFANFKTKLIGNYVADAEVEEPGDSDETAWYLDDIASYMHNKDFRPDMEGDQTLDIYTIGFNTTAPANSLLSRTAANGNGLYFSSNSPEALADAIVNAVADIVQKSQSFTVPTVPTTRTAESSRFYNGYFIPTDRNGWWEGHLKSWTFTSAAEIRDKNGACALDDPTAGQCLVGPFKSTAVPWWDAGEHVPAPASRNLSTSITTTTVGVASQVDFKDTTSGGVLTPTHLTVTYPASPTIPGSTATNVTNLAAEVVAAGRGCKFGTGAHGVTCAPRSWLLGDVFHSSSVVVPRPTASRPEASYNRFKDATLNPTVGLRKKVIVAGANDGFFHIFHAGDWKTTTTPPDYDGGTGAELAGFAPYTARKNIKSIETDSGTRDFYFVDGSPSVADVWLYSSPTVSNEANKVYTEWKTVVIGGMRQGGREYYALDITNPAASSYPGYLWEFPREDQTSTATYMGETWSQPVITRVKVKVNGNDNGGVGFERWVAIFGAGYDKTSDPNSTSTYAVSASAGRAIVMLDIKTGKVLAIKKFDPAGAATDPATFTYDPTRPERSMHYAFTSDPSVYDLDFDGFADVVYIGDLGGNMWKWVIKDIGEDTINGSGNVSQPAWAFGRFFSAPTYLQSGTRYYKSFFFPPSATLKNGVVWLAFGSGERTKLDFAGFTTTTAENNRFYAMTDLDPHELNVPTGGRQPLTESNLLNTTPNENCADVSAYRGYYFLGADGEKFVTSPDIFFYYVFVASYLPTPATNPCEAGGQAYLYAFKVYCGEGLYQNSSGNPERSLDIGDGLPTDPRISCGKDDSQVIVNIRDRIERPQKKLPGLENTAGQALWHELTQ